MTIPTVVSETQKKIAVARLKKDYATFENAFRLAVSEYNTPDNWNLAENIPDEEDPIGTKGAKFIDILSKYIILNKNCGNKAGCSPYTYKHLGGADWVNFDNRTVDAKAMLSDGSNFHVNWKSDTCSFNAGTSKALKNVCGDLGIDINGFNKPNVIGRDYFLFWITKYGIIPNGGQDDNYFTFKTNCNRHGNYSLGCTSWVIYNENMDYLNCDDLSWEGKKTCN